MVELVKKVVILDGTASTCCFSSAIEPLTALFDRDHADVQHIRLQDLNLSHCTGCFGCWIKTPGICAAADRGRDIIRAVAQSDLLVLVTPVTFGGHSSLLKIIIDRFIPLNLPFFQHRGETRHPPRYLRYPRVVGIGIRHGAAGREDDIFKALIWRNALNFHAPSFAAEVVGCADDQATRKARLAEALSRSDPMPDWREILTFLPEADEEPAVQGTTAGKALLLIGSPKTKSRSTSAVLGEHLLGTLKSAAWKTESMTLRRSLVRERGRAELIGAVERSDLIILAFPLYVDTLPYLVTAALEAMAGHRQHSRPAGSQRLFVVANNGFPEFHHNALALAICRAFAERCGLSWAGALAMGAGEALGRGQDLTQPKRSGPPVKHVRRALDRAGEELARGNSVDFRMQRMISKSPIPFTLFSIWRWIFRKFGTRWWVEQAFENGIGKEEMYARPYAVQDQSLNP